MRLHLPSIDGGRFAKGLARRQVQRRLLPFLETVGTERISWIIGQDRPLRSFIQPGTEEALRAKAQEHRWVAMSISDEDLLRMLPPWMHDVIAQHGEQGQDWMRRELGWIREFILGGGDHA